MKEPWVTKKELAAQLQVSPSTIERLGLPHMQVGRQNRYRLSEVELFLRGGDNVIPLRGKRAA